MKLTMADTLMARGRRALNPLARARELPRLATVPPNSPYGEAFRLLSLNVRVLLGERSNKGVVVLSTHRRDGRSSVAANLALALAQDSGVLLVDGYGPEGGVLPDVFERKTTQARSRPEAIPAQATPTDSARLWILNGAAPALRSLGSLSEAVQRASEAGIITIVDSPPAATSSAAFSLAREVGQVIYVLNHKKQDIGVYRGIRDQLRRLHVDILGLVVNEH